MKEGEMKIACVYVYALYVHVYYRKFLLYNLSRFVQIRVYMYVRKYEVQVCMYVCWDMHVSSILYRIYISSPVWPCMYVSYVPKVMEVVKMRLMQVWILHI